MANKNSKKAMLGQFFTPQAVVEFMLRLRQNEGSVMEPSCGNGDFSKHIPNIVAYEMDATVAPDYAGIANFFAVPWDDAFEKYDTIIGNPPYVKHNKIDSETKQLIDSNSKANLYMHFIEKCLLHLRPRGEIIFITPRDFLMATSAKQINTMLFDRGTITHWIDLGDYNLFADACPNVAIWRYEIGQYNRKTLCYNANDGTFLGKPLEVIGFMQKNFCCNNGLLYFTNKESNLLLSDIVTIKVGAVSGADDVYACNAEDEGATEFVYSGTRSTGNTKYYLYPQEAPYKALYAHKDRLLSRGIKKYSEADWWAWGRLCEDTNKPRVYVNCKTRQASPFFTNSCCKWDGSVLSLFPLNESVDVNLLAEMLNSKVDWKDLGFMCGNRYLFGQRSLMNAPLPDCFNQFR